jgi:hypothetical protein
MNADDFKQAWQNQAWQTRLTIDAQRLLDEVRRQQRCFTATIFWRDVREIGTSLLLVPLWIYLGVRHASPWTWYLALPALLWIAGYMLADRRRHRRQPPGPGEPLRRHVETSLAQVDHQIRLLRHVFWWYLLPIAVPFLAFLVQVAWQERSGGWWTALAASEAFAIGAVVLAVIYWLNQYAVRSELEPRRRELQALLMSLEDETPDASRSSVP